MAFLRQSFLFPVFLGLGEWKIESKMGEGTCITLTFPGKEVLHETEK